MYVPFGQATQLASELARRIGEISLTGVELVVFPQFPELPAVATAVGDDSLLSFGAQNCHWYDSGAFTGEVGPSTLARIGARYVIVGHSERRRYCGDTDSTVNLRTKAALSANISPIVCVGESIDERRTGKHFEAVVSQASTALIGLTSDQVGRCVIAYEPLWAIGSDAAAQPEDAEEMCVLIRRAIYETYGVTAGAASRILYGGAVNVVNINSFAMMPDIDGVLVGRSAIRSEDLLGLAAGWRDAVATRSEFRRTE